MWMLVEGEREMVLLFEAISSNLEGVVELYGRLVLRCVGFGRRWGGVLCVLFGDCLRRDIVGDVGTVLLIAVLMVFESVFSNQR